MVKKILHIVFVCFFAAMSIGATVDMHFCAGQLYDIGIVQEAKTCCGQHSHHHSCCHEKSEGGCQDESIVMELHGDYAPASSTGVDVPNVLPIDFLLLFFTVSEIETAVINHPIQTSPPPLPIVRRLALIQSYLI